MTRNEEKQYFAYLEKVIREQKSKSGFFSKGTNTYEMDILMLMNHIAKKNPNLADKIINNFVDTTGMKNCSKQDILTFMGRTEKGTICKWKNEEGEELYLINNGEKFFSKSKQILVFGNHLNKNDLEQLKKSMYGSVLKKDIEKVYQKMERQQNRKIMHKKASLFEILQEKQEQKLERTSSDFEKNFKELVKQQGALCIPQATADTMIAFMDNGEIKKLSQSLSMMGVRNSSDFDALLVKWKNEALHPEYAIERKKIKKKSIDIEVYRNR